MLLAPLISLLTIGYLEVLRIFIDTSVTDKNVHKGITLLGSILLILFMRHLIAAASNTLSYYLSVKAKGRALQNVLQKTNQLPLEVLESEELSNRLERSKQAIQNHFDKVMHPLIQIPISLITSVAIVFYVGSVSIIFPLLFIACVVPLMVIDAKYGRKRWQLSQGQSNLYRKQNYIEKLLTDRNAAHEIRLFGLRGKLINLWKDNFEELSNEKLKLYRKAAFKGLIGHTYVPLTIFVVLVTVIWLVTQGELTVGFFATYVTAVRQFTSSLWVLMSSFTRVNNEMMYVRNYFLFVDKDDEIHTTITAQGNSKVRENLIELRNVSFKYPSSGTWVVKNINLSIKHNECIAIVGKNGAGKTTLSKMLLGLYEPTQGEIILHENYFSDEKRERKSVSAILQNFVRYSATVRENIGFGDHEYVNDDSKIISAAQKSAADEFINDLPYGYESYIGKGKVLDEFQDLSIGQWQRIAIARSYMKESRFLILDEPTAALDAIAETHLYRNFQELARDNTVVLITHRLGSSLMADRIIVMEEGEIIEEGAPLELIKQEGEFSRMFRSQAGLYSKTGEMISETKERL